MWQIAPEEPLARYPDGLRPADLDRLWSDLTGEDAAAAYQAVWTLAAARQPAVAFLQARVRPEAAVDEKRLARLIADLDNDKGSVRDATSQELAGLGHLAEPALRQALEKNPSPEVRRRIGDFFEALPGNLPVELQRLMRAVQVLEQMGSPEARQLLETLAHGAPGARLTREARLALERLRK